MISKTIRGYLVAGAAAALSIFATQAIAADANPVAQAPVWAVGDSWVYQMSDAVEHTWNYKRYESVTAVRDGVPAYAGRNESGSVYSRVTDAEGNETSYHGGHFGGDGHKVLSFPLFVGKEWDATYIRGNGDGNDARVETHAKVVEFKTLHTPAGDLPAYRIEISGSFQMSSISGGAINSQHETMWYAPAAKRLVEYEFTRPSMDRHPAVEWHLNLLSFQVSQPQEAAPETPASN